MTEQELRLLVREAIKFHVGGREADKSGDVPVTLHRQHASHTMFALPAEPGGACVIEPAVPCNHCGFCRSYGH
jgi:hypothetical protein